ncbi:MAG TPA: hypothetical protein VGM09_29465 [Bradyrhizobium sp.]|jgi:hypothetical protein
MMTRHAAWHMWRLSEAGEDNLGLACSDDGLFIGRTPLIEKRDGQFFVRQQHDIERLLSRAYRTEIRADRLMSGLTSVARALNTDDQCLARIAAVHLRIPDIPDRTARDAMEAMDVFVKYARDEGGGDNNWNPALHPRAGTPPNPGWFALTGGAGESFSERTAQNDDPTLRSDASPNTNDDWVRLRPGPKRIDELTDFIEWIANAKPEDVAAISAEIDRYYGRWEAAAKDLKNMLAVLTRPGITKEDRQQYLNRLDLYTRVDPEEYLEIFGFASSLALAGGGIPPISRQTGAAETAVTEARAAAEARVAESGTADAPSDVWNYGWARRGREIHDQLGDQSLHPNFPVIDMFSPTGVITSIKSIDLRAAVYQNDGVLVSRLNVYFNKVSEFSGAEFAEDEVSLDEITGRVLQLVVPRGNMTERQRIIIEAARERAKRLNYPVDLIITEF